MFEITFHVRNAADEPLSADGRLYIEPDFGEPYELETTGGANGELNFSLSASARRWTLFVTPTQPGYWSMVADDIDDESCIVCPDLPAPGQFWWHEWADLRGARGGNMRVGLLDRLYAHCDGISHATLVDCQGNCLQPKAATSLEIGHGEAVCRLVADRSFASLAPDATVFFVDASGAHGGLSIADVIVGILNLSKQHQVDLLSISAGIPLADDPDAPDHPLESLRLAIQEATELGTLCIAAAGNGAENPVCSPAAFRDCAAVGAAGQIGWGAPGSVARRWDSEATQRGARTNTGAQAFRWKFSGYGAGLDLLAPGVGLIVGRGGVPAYDLIGTSFAAPVACGALAARLGGDPTYHRLPRDRTRATYARKTLEAMCTKAGFSSTYQGCGILMV